MFSQLWNIVTYIFYTIAPSGFYQQYEQAPVPQERHSRHDFNERAEHVQVPLATFQPHGREVVMDTTPEEHKKSENRIIGSEVVDHRKWARDRSEEERRYLIAKRRDLRERVTRLEKGVQEQSEIVQSLRKEKDEGKWEDELYHARSEELDSTRAMIDTQSSVNRRDVRRQIAVLNKRIARAAEYALEGGVRRRGSQVQLENIDGLRPSIALFLRRGGSLLSSPKVIQAILRMVLVESCMELIESWYPEKKNLDASLRNIYLHIREREEQMVAGKWRRITSSQVAHLRHGESKNFLEWHAEQKARQIVAISSFAGWEGEPTALERQIQKVMEEAEKIREFIKSGIISADLEPCIAEFGQIYDQNEMEDVSWTLGLQSADRQARGYHVLGSAELGLRLSRMVDDRDNEFKNAQTRPRVLLLESLGFSYRQGGSNK